MMPKIIHYCWFGNAPKPAMVKKCIKSWEIYFPQYKIVEWNEDNFNVHQCDYSDEAYKCKKWAFVSDYARLKVLYEYGGIYFDTDVEIIKPISDIVNNGNFLAIEKSASAYNDGENNDQYVINPGLGIGCNKYDPVLKKIISDYEVDHFILGGGRTNEMTIVSRFSKYFGSYGFSAQDNIQHIKNYTIYPTEYFCPIDYYTGIITISEKTRSIHHYDASWSSKKDRFNRKIRNLLVKLFGQARGISLYKFFKRIYYESHSH